MTSASSPAIASPSQWQMLRAHRIGFTLWNLGLAFVALVTQDPFVLAVAFCSSFGVMVSFHIGWLFDPCGVERLICKNNLPKGGTFHFYNILVHVVPVIVLAIYIKLHGVPVATHHGLWSSVLHMTWGLVETNGHLLLDDIYVNMDPHHWHCMWLTAILAEALAPQLL
eukprot:TRINITY_DN3179_c0_g1_i1.p1 TRINITY_DN3179_c0_g1~~TRINITY_DN3179_c0_g1_i1.p1  ORF type:complete len:168 (+),score=17.42 TRINITY_DN3179_c0_g1_i1:161-664(+)